VRKRTFFVTGVALLASCVVLAQQSNAKRGDPAQQPSGAEATDAGYVPTMTFDVASIRQAKIDRQLGFSVSGGFDPPNSSNLVIENHNIMMLIARAYPGEDHRTDGYRNLSADLRSAFFDVKAKADEATDAKLAKLSKRDVWLEHAHMIQLLLQDRFNLKVHWETRDSATYDLVVTKPNKLQTTGAPPSDEEVKTWGDRGVPSLYQKGDSRTGFEYIAHGATAADIADVLSGQFGLPVNDKTGLSGKYYFDLKTYQVKANERAEDETNPWPPLETAIQDQLGLKLVPSHGPVKFLVIDHAEMPSPN
jgi:uncharacterized protein (TIGR03435 family)